jgi:hypothetical protein
MTTNKQQEMVRKYSLKHKTVCKPTIERLDFTMPANGALTVASAVHDTNSTSCKDNCGNTLTQVLR